jgi:hypothetical protein
VRTRPSHTIHQLHLLSIQEDPMITRIVVLLALIAFLSPAITGCYHATVETGLTPSTEVIEESFASCWIYGLVPPSTIATQMKCKHGVAKVETQHSFVNGLVAGITFGIYTPISIKVTCAAAGTTMLEGRNPDLVVEENATEVEIRNAFAKAADKAVAIEKPVYLKY